MSINLARKWRSKQFDELVGQPLAVRLIKNSLYRNLLFPVYLLSGMRGTGKTSMARIFAAALNCSRLKDFQADPRITVVPCLACESCLAMQQMNHPDFMEIDAASHTGVDNVRQIIDSASFVPVLGTKKIYLIDEAHMLSKAAFNAFLKVLEEPPASVVFMLATTDSHKILPTVVSRCFQIFFDPIKPTVVADHLVHICAQEGLEADVDALLLIAHETEGSLRDALNLLERLRGLPDLATSEKKTVHITAASVRTLLGTIDDDRICELLYTVVTDDIPSVLALCSQFELSRYSPTMVWKKLVEIIGRSLWLKQNTLPDELPVSDSLKKFVAVVSYKQLVSLLEICYAYELSFAKTTVPSTLLELILLKMVSVQEGATFSRPQRTNSAITPAREEKKDSIKETGLAVAPEELKLEKKVVSVEPLPLEELKKDAREPSTITVIEEKTMQDGLQGKWGACLAALESVSDPLVLSIFKQCSGHLYVEREGTLELTFSQDLLFFKDWLGNTEKIWRPTLEKFFGAGTLLISKFDGVSTKVRPLVTPAIKPVTPSSPAQPKVQESVPPTQRKNFPQQNGQVGKPAMKAAQPTGKAVSPQMVQKLSTGVMLMELFPGRIVEYEALSEEGSHES